MYLVAWIDRKVAMATKATVMEEICQSDILYVLGGAAGRLLDHKVAMATKDTDRRGLLVDDNPNFHPHPRSRWPGGAVFRVPNSHSKGPRGTGGEL